MADEVHRSVLNLFVFGHVLLLTSQELARLRALEVKEHLHDEEVAEPRAKAIAC